MAITMDIYEKIRYYQAQTDYSQRTVAKMLGISRNTVKKYWKGQAMPHIANIAHYLLTSQGAQVAPQRCPILPVSKA